MPDEGWRLEQHVGVVMQALVIGLLAWTLKSSVEMQTQIGVLQAELRALQDVVSQSTRDRYRESDAARDHAAIWAELNRHTTRLDKLENVRR